jgi:hypothetical protein
MWTNSTHAQLNATGEFAKIRAANFDVLYSYLVTKDTPSATIEAYLDACDVAGLKAMLTVRELGKNVAIANGTPYALTAPQLATLTAFAEAWHDHPALWGWYADDEGGITYPIAARQQVYDALKAVDSTKQVFEVHYDLISGAYSPDVHDWFGLDSGPAATNSYVYKYDDYAAAPNYGSVSKSTGLVTSTSNETAALNAFGSRLSTLKASLIAAGDTNYFVCMQGFRQGAAGSVYFHAMPPDGGVDKIWAKVQAAGMDAYGAGWFLWLSDDSTTLPGEQLDGVGESGYSAQLAEVAAIAETMQTTVVATAAADHIDLAYSGTAPFLIERRVV